MTQLTPQQWSEVDNQILASYRVYAIDLIQRFGGVELAEACRLFEAERQKLVAQCPERFEMSAEERSDIALEFVAARFTV